MNRVDFKLQGRVQADAENSSRWSTDTVDGLFRYVFDNGWRRILNGDCTYRYTAMDMTSDSDGIITLAAVNAVITPDRFNRVFDQRTVRDKGLTSPTQLVLNPRVTGSEIRFGPGGVGEVKFWINQLPQNPEDYTGATADTVDVDWPDGHELVLQYHLAAMLLTKGAVEAGAAASLFAVVDSLYTEMIQALMDRSTQHQQIIPVDTADSWSGGMSW